MIKKILLTTFCLILLVLYAFTLKGILRNPLPPDFKNRLDQATQPFETSQERARYGLTLSLIKDRSFALSQTLADIGFPDVGYHHGRFYIYFPPGISVLAIPFYLIGEMFDAAQLATFSLSIVFALLTEIFIYKTGKDILRSSSWASFFAVLVYAFGSISWGYAVTLYQHQVSAFLLISSLYAVWYFRNCKNFRWLAAFYVWFSYGLAIFVDYSNVFLIAPSSVFLVVSAFSVVDKRSFIRISFKPVVAITAAAFIIVNLIHAYYNQTNFDAWYRLSGSITGYKTIKERGIDVTTDQGRRTIEQLTQEKNPVGFFKEENFLRGLVILTVSRDRGLFLYSPIFIVSILGVIRWLRERKVEMYALMATAGGVLFLYSSWGDPWGGWAFGPRYLIPILPILSLSVAYWMTSVQFRNFSKLLVFLLFLPSAAIALLGALTTNAVPPKVEADQLHMKYNFLLNLDFLKEGKSSSFVYNTYLSNRMSLIQYYFLIYIAVITMTAATVFVLPIFDRHD